MEFPSKTVLVVDDEVEIVDTIIETLETTKANCLRAHSGAEALQLLDKNRIHVVITDVNMPKMTGLQLLSEIKKKHYGIPVIIITAYGNKDMMKESWQNGAFNFLEKPLILDEVLKVTEEALASGWNSEYYKMKEAAPENNVEFKVKVEKGLAGVTEKYCKDNSVSMSELVEFLLIKFITNDYQV